MGYFKIVIRELAIHLGIGHEPGLVRSPLPAMLPDIEPGNALLDSFLIHEKFRLLRSNRNLCALPHSNS